MAGGDGWWGKYSYRFSHTSSAAPLVTGIAAIVLEANPQLTARELKEILINTADRVSPMDANYDADGHSDKYGFGRVNALRAVAAAWILGGGTITAGLKDDIDESSPCTKDDCWNFEGAEYPDEELPDYNTDPDDEADIDSIYVPDEDLEIADETVDSNEMSDVDDNTPNNESDITPDETQGIPDSETPDSSQTPDNTQNIPDEAVEDEAGCGIVFI
jgi:hypothetical protein